ncbi:MAG: hypothetical protein ACYDAO_05225 [Thermoplasmataceae archaeon]
MSNFDKDLRKVCLKTAAEIRKASLERDKRYSDNFGYSPEREFVALLFHNFLSDKLSESYTVSNLGLEWVWRKKRNGKRKNDHPDLIYWNEEEKYEVVEVKAIRRFGKRVDLLAGDRERINEDYEKLCDMSKTNEIESKYLVVAFLGKENYTLRDIEEKVNESLESRRGGIKVIVC